MIHFNRSIKAALISISGFAMDDNEFICGEQHVNSIEYFLNFAKNID